MKNAVRKIYDADRAKAPDLLHRLGVGLFLFIGSLRFFLCGFFFGFGVFLALALFPAAQFFAFCFGGFMITLEFGFRRLVVTFGFFLSGFGVRLGGVGCGK